MKVYRDHARTARGITAPEMIVPVDAPTPRSTRPPSTSASTKVTVPVGPDGRADVAATEAAITANTAVIVGSAPCFPHGLDRPDRRARRARPCARHRLPHRRLPRRVRAAVGRAARLPGAAVRLPRARRDLDVGRHPQVRLRGQGHVGRALPRQGAAPPPVLHDHRLAGRALLLADVRRHRGRAR